jgi:ribonuclease HI
MYNLFLITADTNPPLHILCDSKYVIGAMNGNRANVNADLIEKLLAVSAGRDFTLEWVKGHNGHPLNDGADKKCTAASAAVHAGLVIPTGPGWTITAAVQEVVEPPLPATVLDPLTMELPF